MINQEEDKIFHTLHDLHKMSKDTFRYTNKDNSTYFQGNPYDVSDKLKGINQRIMNLYQNIPSNTSLYMMYPSKKGLIPFS